MWKKEALVEIHNRNQMHISAWIVDENKQAKWLLTGFYVELNTCRRLDSWHLDGNLL